MDRTTRGQGGWSLPITWILLAGVIALAFVGGWQVIPIAIGIVVAIGLAVAAYDRLRHWATARASHSGLWFYGYQSLEDVADRLSLGMDLLASEVDRERALDWLKLTSLDGTLKLSLVRQNDWRNDPAAPCIVLPIEPEVSKKSDTNTALGLRLCEALATDVFHGRVRIVNGAKIERVEQGRYPGTAPETGPSESID